MSAIEPPEPISYALDAGESASLVARTIEPPGRLPVYPIVAGMSVINLTTALLLFRRYGWYGPMGCAAIGVGVAFVVWAVLFERHRRRYVPVAMRPDVATSVTFHDTSFDVVRDDGSPRKAVRVSAVRSIAVTPEAFIVATGSIPMLVIPKRVFADGGEHFVAFFENRLVGRRLLRRPSGYRASIVNTASR